MSLSIKTKFYGTSVGVLPYGSKVVKLNNRNETYSMTRPTFILHNIIIGTIYCEFVGTMIVKKESNHNQ